MPSFNIAKPDFIIAGAMKCGTTWLHHALNSLPQISIPDEEIHLADAEDFISHGDFFRYRNGKIITPDTSNTSWAARARTIRENNPDNLIGWDSTTLFHSHLDFERIASEYSDTKIIVLLRDPTNRSYSHYWHLVRTGRCSKPFEKAILHGSNEIIHRSIYRDQALKVKEAFQDRVLFVLYEDLFSSPHEEFARILRFLDLTGNYHESLTASLNKKSNSGIFPNFVAGWLFASRLLSGLEKGRYASKLSDQTSLASLTEAAGYKFKQCAMVLAGAGYSRSRRIRINPEIRIFLNKYLSEANYSLDSIIDLEASKCWFT